MSVYGVLYDNAESLKDYYKSVVPGALTAAGLETIPEDGFLTVPPFDIDGLSFIVDLAEGEEKTTMTGDAFVVTVYLPGITHSNKHLSVMWDIVRKTDPELLNRIDIETTYQKWNAADAQNLSGSSFVVFEIRFSGVLDDCEE